MKKTISISTVLFLMISCSPQLEIPLSDVKLENQQEHFILGMQELKVVLTKATINPQTKLYTVWGYTDFLATPDDKFAKKPRVRIKKISNGDTTLYGYPGKWGKFKIKMPNSDTLMFDWEQYKLLYIQAIYP